jgi:bifunctional DNase/RNase
LANVISLLEARVLRVEVVALRDDTFFGNIVAEKDGNLLNIDARPSDALAIAVRSHVPILVARSVMETAGIVPEEDLQEQSAEEVKPAKLAKPASTEPEAEGSEDRLSVFQDFLEGLDLDDTDENNEENEDKEH